MNLVIIGVGIMGIILVILVKELVFELDVIIFEWLSGLGVGNFWVFNNVGIGYEVNCEFNYMLVDEEVIFVEKVLKIYVQFNVVKQFWVYLIDIGVIKDLIMFINCIKYCMIVVEFVIEELCFRYKEMFGYYFFDQM